jgi:hypothetical protein
VLLTELLTAVRALAPLPTGSRTGWKPDGELPDGLSAFPSASGVSGGSDGSEAGHSWSNSSSITDSGVRSTPSATRMRPESAAYAASRAVSRPGSGSPRSSARPVSTNARSIAPRTDDPIRTSRCSRVARVSATDMSTQRPERPLTDDVIARSPASSW